MRQMEYMKQIMIIMNKVLYLSTRIIYKDLKKLNNEREALKSVANQTRRR